MDLYTLFGLAGAAGYISSYVLLQLGLLDGNGVRYSIANVIAACLMLVSLLDQFHLGVAMIQIIWIVFGVWGLTRRSVTRYLSGSDIADSDLTQTDTASLLGMAQTGVGAANDRWPGTQHAGPHPTLALRSELLASYHAAKEASSSAQPVRG